MGGYIAGCLAIGGLPLRKRMLRKKAAAKQRKAEEEQRREAERKLEKQQMEQKEEQLLGQAIKLGNMILYENNRTVYARGKTHCLSKSAFELLLLFAKAPNHTLTAATIKDKFWSGHIDPRNNMYNLISKLKKGIEPFSRCEICSESEELYRLTFPETASEE